MSRESKTGRFDVRGQSEASSVTAYDEIEISEIVLKLQQASTTVEACAYDLAGRSGTDVVVQMIGVAADLDRLARRLTE